MSKEVCNKKKRNFSGNRCVWLQ